MFQEKAKVEYKDKVYVLKIEKQKSNHFYFILKEVCL